MQNFTHRRVAMGLAGAAILVASTNAAAFLGIDVPSGRFKFEVGGVSLGNTNYGTECSLSPGDCDDASTEGSGGLVGGTGGAEGAYDITWDGPGGDGMSYKEDSWGVGTVSRIIDANTLQTLWNEGDAGVKIAFMYGQVVDRTIAFTGTGGLTLDIASVEGSLSFWTFDATENLDITGGASNRTAVDAYNGVTNLSGSTKVVEFAFTPGAVAGDSVTTYKASFDTSTISGNGQAFADVVEGVGSDWEWFNTQGEIDQNGDFRDTYLTFTADSTGPAGWDLNITGQAYGQAPIPGTLALLGLGLFGLYGGLRRRA
jgi:hypothetical protein